MEHEAGKRTVGSFASPPYIGKAHGDCPSVRFVGDLYSPLSWFFASFIKPDVSKERSKEKFKLDGGLISARVCLVVERSFVEV